MSEAEDLHQLAKQQWAAGQQAEAVQTLLRRVAVYEQLAAKRPAIYEPQLAAALVDVCAFRRVEDIPLPEQVGERAVTLFRRLGDDTGLAGALYFLSHAQWMSSHRAAAVATMRERAELYERLAATDPALTATLAAALTDLCAFRRVEDMPLPIEAGARAVALFRGLTGISSYTDLAGLTPGPQWPGLAGALYLLGYAQDLAGDTFRAALSMAQRVPVHERLAAADPVTFAAQLRDARTESSTRLAAAIADGTFRGRVLRGAAPGVVHDAAPGPFLAGYLDSGQFFGCVVTGPAEDGFLVVPAEGLSPEVSGVVTAELRPVGGGTHDGLPVTATVTGPHGGPVTVTGTVHPTGGTSTDGVPVSGPVTGTSTGDGTISGTLTGSVGADGTVTGTISATTSAGTPVSGPAPGALTPAVPSTTSVATTTSTGSSSMPDLTNSTRTFLKATYDRIGVQSGAGSTTALRVEPTAFEKLAFARDVALSPAEAQVVAARAEPGPVRDAVEFLASAVTGPAAAPQAARRAAAVPADDLVAAAGLVGAVRRDDPAAAALPLSGEPQPVAVRRGGAGLDAVIERFVERRQAEPVAWLHLERVEMTPVGVERGELVATVPMAPGEKVSVSHKEWSSTSSEFEDIVTDELDTYSEKGVAEKTDAAMSNESETKRETAMNFGVSAKGSYGPVTLTTSLDVKAADSERSARSSSVKQTVEQTRKSSARVRKEHKVSMRVETRSGTEDIAAKEIHNDSGRAIRIDYYRMMRKWRVDLIRYGIRMTYDLVVPDPGASLRRTYVEIVDLRSKLGPFTFGLTHNAITEGSYLIYAERYGAQVEDPPDTLPPMQVSLATTPGIGTGHHNFAMQLDVPDGQQVAWIKFTARVTSPPEVGFGLRILGTTYEKREPQSNQTYPSETLMTTAGQPYLQHARGRLQVILLLHDAETAAAELTVSVEPTTSGFEAWRQRTWNALYAAAQTQYYAQQQDLAARIAELEASADRDDTLTLRRAEREEIMRRTLQWLFGPQFDVSPGRIEQVLDAASADESELLIQPADWQGIREFGEFVKFLHHAIEWENILYFLYPYFWASPAVRPQSGPSADTSLVKQRAWHPDPTRREFMRAGAARVVLPVRPGYETEFAQLMELGVLGGPGGDDTPYLTIATEMQQFARTNYAGIPSANPDVKARTRPLITLLQQRAWDDIQELTAAVGRYAAARKAQDVPGWTGVPTELKYYPTAAQGFTVLPGPLPLTDPWGTKYRYESPGQTAPFVIASLGARNQPGGTGEETDLSTDAEGNLISTWFEYTPSSGIDIQVDTPLTGAS